MHYFIASVSFGKDSLAMLLMLLEKNCPLDEVVFYDTGMEFQAIYDTRNRVLPLLAKQGIEYTELHPPRPFVFDMLEKPVYSVENGRHCGYSWCGGCARWGTAEKQQALDVHAKKYSSQGYTVFQYVGIAADEPKRLERIQSQKLAPLADWGKTENKCLTYCYNHGFDWVEDGGAGEVSLYYVLDRVSCWCCSNKNLKELRNIYHLLPTYWERLKDLHGKLVAP